MAKFYVDANNGSDTTGDGTRKFPYATLQKSVTSNKFIKNTTIILKDGVYDLYHNLFSSIDPDVALTVIGQGLKTTVSVAGVGNTFNVGSVLSTVVFRKLNFINTDQPFHRVRGTGSNTSLYDTAWYLNSRVELRFYNVCFNLNKVGYYTAYSDVTYGRIGEFINSKFIYFFQDNNNLYFENCTSISNAYMIYNSNKTTILNCYGNFSGSNTNWTKVNSVLVTKPELNSEYKNTNVEIDDLKLGVYHGNRSWNFNNYIIWMDNKYYSINDEFYNGDSKMYSPITIEDINANGFDYYAQSDISEFLNERQIGGVTSKVSPIMTSDILPSPYVVSSSGTYNSTYSAWKAFNGTNSNIEDCWITPSKVVDGWIMLDLNTATTINSFAVTSRYHTTDFNSAPKDFTLEGSDDGLNFVVIKTITDETVWGSNVTKEYKLDEDITYRYYKIDVTANNGQTYTSIAQIKLFYTEPLIDIFKPIDKFDNFRIIADTNNIIKVNAIKSNKELIVASGDIRISVAGHIDYIKLASNVSELSDIRIVLSRNKGINWFTSVDGVNFTNIDCIIPRKDYSDMSDEEKVKYTVARDTIAKNGMTVETFNLIDFNKIDTYNIRLAYVLKRPTYDDISEVNELSWKFNAKGCMKELKDNEYDTDVYEHRVQTTSLINTDIIKISIVT